MATNIEIRGVKETLKVINNLAPDSLRGAMRDGEDVATENVANAFADAHKPSARYVASLRSRAASLNTLQKLRLAKSSDRLVSSIGRGTLVTSLSKRGQGYDLEVGASGLVTPGGTKKVDTSESSVKQGLKEMAHFVASITKANVGDEHKARLRTAAVATTEVIADSFIKRMYQGWKQ